MALFFCSDAEHRQASMNAWRDKSLCKVLIRVVCSMMMARTKGTKVIKGCRVFIARRPRFAAAHKHRAGKLRYIIT